MKFLVLLFIFLSSCERCYPAKHPQIHLMVEDDLSFIYDRNVLKIDARNPISYNELHINGSVNIMTRSQTNCSGSIPHKALRMLKEEISLWANGSTPLNSSLCILQPQEYREVEVLFIDYIGPRGDAYKG